MSAVADVGGTRRERKPEFAIPCAVCLGRVAGPRSVRFLTHGVWVWLCATHGSASYMRRDGGRALVERLRARWASLGVLEPRRRVALAGHLTRVKGAFADAGKPGSHSWPRLRREAERRFAAGEPPADVITTLRAQHADGPARPPSVRTMRRWFAQGRWLRVDDDEPGASAAKPPAPKGPSDVPKPPTGVERPPEERLRE